MTQTVKTLIFVAAAAASVVVAAGTYYSNKPVSIADFNDVGDEFYPTFDDPSQATGMRVAAYNEATGKTEVFKVENRNGLWRIPSHHDYPADGKEQLAKMAASMIGVRREALIERSKSAQKRYDLEDPLDTEVSGTEGRGDRITLFKGDEVLVDFIVGKKAEDSATRYFIRRADEDRSYTADLGNFVVSTKFADWIEKDVLDVEPDDVREVLISRYFVDETQGKVVQQGKIDLTRANSTDPWAIHDLKADEEKVKTAEIGTLLTSLSDLQIVGVRRKPEALIAGLKSEDGSIAIDPLTQRDLQLKGVFISGRGAFVYNEGKVNVGTDAGVQYELGFGEEFSGSDIDIEIGGQTSPEAEAKALEKATEKTPEDADAKEAEVENAEKAADGNSPEEPGKKKSRYLFVTTIFNKDLLGPEPVAPVEPKKPADEPKKEKKEEPAADASADQPAEKKEEAAADAEKKPEEAKSEEAKPEEKKPDVQKAYEDALKEYELQKEVYEIKKKDYAEKIKAGEKRVAELNSRFADWYYVISEDVFDRLKLKREDLVEPVTPEEKKPAEEAAAAPAPEKQEKMSAPAERAPAAETPKTPASDSPAAEGDAKAKMEEKPKAEEKPASEEKPKSEDKPKTDEAPKAEPPKTDEKPAAKEAAPETPAAETAEQKADAPAEKTE